MMPVLFWLAVIALAVCIVAYAIVRQRETKLREERARKRREARQQAKPGEMPTLSSRDISAAAHVSLWTAKEGGDLIAEVPGREEWSIPPEAEGTLVGDLTVDELRAEVTALRDQLAQERGYKANVMAQAADLRARVAHEETMIRDDVERLLKVIDELRADNERLSAHQIVDDDRGDALDELAQLSEDAGLYDESE